MTTQNHLKCSAPKETKERAFASTIKSLCDAVDFVQNEANLKFLTESITNNIKSKNHRSKYIDLKK